MQEEKAEAPPSAEELLRLQALSELERSQMPAIASNKGDGHLIKTIEHYSFADGDDTVSFYVHFDKDLWEGASSFIGESQVRVESHATSLDIRLEGVPVSKQSQ